MNKEEITVALSKSQKDLTDTDITSILEVPDQFWPTNPFNYTAKLLTEEKQRRAFAARILFQEILADVMHLSTLRQLASFGPRIFPEMDLLGLDDITDEIRRLEPIVRKKITKYKGQ